MVPLCPRCRSMLVARAEGSGWLDVLPALLGRVRFNCRNCQHCFQSAPIGTLPFWLTPAPRKWGASSARIPVCFECATDTGEGTLTNLSVSGCLLDSQQALRPGLVLRLHLPVDAEAASTAVRSLVATVRETAGATAHLTFMAYTPEEKTHLEDTVTRTLRKFRRA